MVNPGDVTFACDAMLGGLARWLRAPGYDASWRSDIDDWELIRLARREQRVLLTSDSGIFRIGIVRDGEVPSLLIPQGLTKVGQLAFVLRKLELPRREPRCRACGGPLVELPKEEIRDRVPARTLGWLQHFYQCSRCRQLFWQGTHWQQIASRLEHDLYLPDSALPSEY
jgi:uncharacterized protein with PIN domain